MIVATPSESAFFKKTQIWRFLCEEKRQSIVLTMERLVGDKGLKKKATKEDESILIFNVNTKY